MVRVRYDQDTIKIKRNGVASGLMKESVNIKGTKIVKIADSDLEIMFRYYDQIFFDGWFRDNFKGKFRFALSRRMTRSAGITECPKNIGTVKGELITIQIRLGVNLFFQYDSLEGSKSVCGIDTCNSLEALQIVFEHEMCHALEFIIYNSSNCRARRFQEIANNLFGHTKSHHKLPTNRQIASQKLGINIGDKVNFIHDGKRVGGVVSGINRRATVMVRNIGGHFVDRVGNRYIKYYVPIDCVEKVK